MLTDPLMSVARSLQFRGKRRLLAGLIPSRGEASATIFGYRVRLDLAEAMQREIYMGTFEPDEAAMLQGVLKPGMTFVDVGANVGFFTLMAARAVGPGGHVHAVEPGPYAHRRLEVIVRENGIAQVTVHPIGLGMPRGRSSSTSRARRATTIPRPRSPTRAGGRSPSPSGDSTIASPTGAAARWMS